MGHNNNKSILTLFTFMFDNPIVIDWEEIGDYRCQKCKIDKILALSWKPWVTKSETNRCHGEEWCKKSAKLMQLKFANKWLAVSQHLCNKKFHTSGSPLCNSFVLKVIWNMYAQTEKREKPLSYKTAWPHPHPLRCPIHIIFLWISVLKCEM